MEAESFRLRQSYHDRIGSRHIHFGFKMKNRNQTEHSANEVGSMLRIDRVGCNESAPRNILLFSDNADQCPYLQPASMIMASRKILPHEIPTWVKSGTPFFITICCVQRGKNQLCLENLASHLLDCAKFYHRTGDWHCRLLLLMPDHLHALASFPSDIGMKQFVRKFKIYTSRQCGISWQRNFFDHRPRNAAELEQKAEYIRENPVRTGLVATAADWKFFWESLDS
jgi:REP element-mobilizing transposase RayT